MTAAAPYPRDLIGYGRTPPHADWPGGARLALQIVLNYEEGGEACILHGDSHAEAYLQEVPGIAPLEGVRNIQVESMYEYGARAGFWRLMRLFEERGIPVTVYAVAMALARNPDAAAAIREAGHEAASHGLRWIDYQAVPEDVERAHIAEAIRLHTEVMGERPLGWYTGRVSPNTRRLVAEAGGFLYDADSYADDLPYWEAVPGVAEPQLIVPYTLDNNDMKFSVLNGFASGEDFYAYLRDAFDVLYAEGADTPKMMSVGLHCRLAGRPGRMKALMRFLDHVQAHDRVWITRRVDIARHWRERHPPSRKGAA
ncbi:Uricase (urate oxidase) [Caenispirillum salinarum AK4]|uniref:Chitooligosaccharide deacetylase n=1 Tax=Caenispirillum salinarum AK4 TaxID=1238182 RepID=K9GU57_9PROT|nr:allantoinase PuuE [Caenispirillum salinarum]EKV28682.1 Uricase (urate oxidase) [Caenispirillum salinarum AK4]